MRIIGTAVVAIALLALGSGVAVAAGGGPVEGQRRAGPLGGAAEYLGLTREQVRDALRAEKSLAQITREQGKSVDGLEQALRADAEQKLAQAVAAGRLTEEQKAEMLARLDEHLDELVNATGGFRGGCGEARGGEPAPAAASIRL